ncbi:MAG: electron transport complex subunit RsxA, partial [Gammaproteobacteria bacterium]|nr:electron transport complex subunit RsxA [Gammaproteobacteria bacterium]
MDDLLWIFISTLLVNNFVLAYFLGLCPFLGVSGQLETSFRLGLATTFVLVITALCAWVLNTYVLIYAPYLRLISFIVVIASTVQFIEMSIKKL